MVLTAAMHRDETIWQNPNEFDPDRFLTPGEVDKDAFQPFAKGPRNCIGQQLALIEAKVITVLTLRFFDFQPAFRDDSESIPNWGGKAHQIVRLTAKPKDGLPMTVKIHND
jgi:cytochrome P450